MVLEFVVAYWFINLVLLEIYSGLEISISLEISSGYQLEEYGFGKILAWVYCAVWHNFAVI